MYRKVFVLLFFLVFFFYVFALFTAAILNTKYHTGGIKYYYNGCMCYIYSYWPKVPKVTTWQIWKKSKEHPHMYFIFTAKLIFFLLLGDNIDVLFYTCQKVFTFKCSPLLLMHLITHYTRVGSDSGNRKQLPPSIHSFIFFTFFRMTWGCEFSPSGRLEKVGTLSGCVDVSPSLVPKQRHTTF